MTVNVLVPSSLTREETDKRAATRKLGYVARAAVIFGVDRLVIFPDSSGESEGSLDGGFVETVLRYALTPPHLRKDVWKSRDELEYAGVLPPLGTISQTGSGSDDSGSLRQGIVTEVGTDGRVRVNCGMQHPISVMVPFDRDLQPGERVTVRIISRRPVRATLVDAPVPGPSVERTDLLATLDHSESGFRIATSRHGEPLTPSGLSPLTERIAVEGCTIAFGAPQRGLQAILADHPGVDEQSKASVESDSASADWFDLWLNAVPHQGSEIIRTEEAMIAVLACLTLME